MRELKGEEIEDEVRATVNLKVDLKIDESYVPDMNQRLMLYRTVAAARDEVEIDDVLEGAHDRYGPLPESVRNLADYGRIRVMADRLGIESIDREARAVVLKFRPQGKIDPVRLLALVRERKDITLAPPSALRLSLDTLGIRDSGLGIRRDAGAAGPGDSGSKSLRPNPKSRIQNSKYSHVAPSWWTARAREGESSRGSPRPTFCARPRRIQGPRAACSSASAVYWATCWIRLA